MKTLIHALFLASLTATTLTSYAVAQTLTSGFSAGGSTPSVALPQPPTPSAVLANETKPEPVTVEVTRAAGEAAVVDRNTVPAAVHPATPGNAAITRTDGKDRLADTTSRYRTGMVLSGKGRAVDGHTLFVGEHPVRLNGIDAPGFKQTCSTRAGLGWKCGRKAFERLSALISDGMVRCTVIAPARGGASARCSASQSPDIGKMLLSEGLAVPNKNADAEYRGASLSAARSRRGLWMGHFEAPTRWRQSNR